MHFSIKKKNVFSGILLAVAVFFLLSSFLSIASAQGTGSNDKYRLITGYEERFYDEIGWGSTLNDPELDIFNTAIDSFQSGNEESIGLNCSGRSSPPNCDQYYLRADGPGGIRYYRIDYMCAMAMGSNTPEPPSRYCEEKNPKDYNTLAGGIPGIVTIAYDGPNDITGYTFNDASSAGLEDSFTNISGRTENPDNITPTRGDSAGSDASDEERPSCEDSSPMAWGICPLVEALDSALNWVDTQIQRLLEIDKDYYANDEIKSAWATIRNTAYIILIPMMLAMVIGTALGFDFVSAYTVKKALPRFFIAVIFIALSYHIGVFLIEFFNVIGRGILGFLTAPFDQLDGSLTLSKLFAPGNVGTGAFSGLLSLAALGIGVAVIVWLFAGTLLLFAGTAFLVLLVRQIFIVALLLVAPLAILAWIFPANVRLWKMWWGSFSKLLMMFPIIMALLAVGRIFAVIIWAGDGGSLQGAVIQPLMTMAAWMIPYAFIPFTFKMAGGVFATVTGVINDKEKGLFDRQKKSRAEKLGRAKHGNLFKNAPAGSRLNRLNNVAAGAMNIKQAGLNPRQMRARMATASSQHHFEDAQEIFDKNGDFAVIKQDDDLLRAVKSNRTGSALRQHLQSTGRFNTAEELNGAVAMVERVRKSGSSDAVNIASTLALSGTGTGYGNVGEMVQDIADTSHGDRMLATRMLGSMRSIASQSRRTDLGGAGFGVMLGELNSAIDGNGVNVDHIHEQVLRGNGGGAIVGAKRSTVEQLAPRMLADVEAAYQSNDQGQIDRTLAAIAGRYDAMAQISPENAEVMANTVLSGGVNVPRVVVERDNDGNITRRTVQGATVRQLIEDARQRPPDDHGNQSFLEMRREYASAGIAAANQQAAEIGAEPVGQPPVAQ